MLFRSNCLVPLVSTSHRALRKTRLCSLCHPWKYAEVPGMSIVDVRYMMHLIAPDPHALERPPGTLVREKPHSGFRIERSPVRLHPSLTPTPIPRVTGRNICCRESSAPQPGFSIRP